MFVDRAIATSILLFVSATAAMAQAPWCHDPQQYQTLIKADNAVWANAESKPHPTKWARYLAQPMGCHHARAKELMALAVETPIKMRMHGKPTWTHPVADTYENGAKLQVASELHYFTLNFGVSVPKYEPSTTVPALKNSLAGRGLFIRYRCDWDEALGGSKDVIDSDQTGTKICGHPGEGNEQGAHFPIRQAEFKLHGILADYFDLIVKCWGHLDRKTELARCDPPQSEAMNFLYAIQLTIIPKKKYLDYLADYKFMDASIGQPAPWTIVSGNVFALARNGASFTRPIPYGYRVCQTEGEGQTKIYFRPRPFQENVDVNHELIRRGECFEVDSPTQLMVSSTDGNGPALAGHYQMFHRGAFPKEGRVVKIPAGMEAVMSVSSNEQGQESRVSTAMCTKLPKKNPQSPPTEFFASCRLLEPLKRARSVRLCLSKGYAPHGSNNSEWDYALLRMSLEQRWSRENPPPSPKFYVEWGLNYIMTGCRDLHNIHVADMLVAPATYVPGSNWNPEAVDIIKFTSTPLIEE